MKFFYLKGYVPQDGEHVLIDEEEYVAHEIIRTEKNPNSFWNEHCKKCAFYNEERALDCDVINSKEVRCCIHYKRYLYFEKVETSV